jgi:hypothetical protein
MDPNVPAFNQVAIHRIDKNEAELTEKTDGVTVALVLQKISKQGTELTLLPIRRDTRTKSMCGGAAEARRTPLIPLSAGDQVVEKDRRVVSADGLQMTVTTTGMPVDRESLKEDLIFRKQ